MLRVKKNISVDNMEKLSALCSEISAFVPAFILPVVIGYVVHYGADFVYDRNNCSLPWRMGSIICESSHTLSTESRKYLYMFINQSFGAFIGYTMSVLTAMRVVKIAKTN